MKVKATSDVETVSATPIEHSSFSKFHQLKKEACKYVGEYHTHTSQLFGGIVARDFNRATSGKPRSESKKKENAYYEAAFQVTGKSKLKIEKRNCEKYIKSQNNRKNTSPRQLQLFHGYFQNGNQVSITATQDGKGYQPIEPVYFCTTKYTKMQRKSLTRKAQNANR